jgi:hypothetical protein
MYDMSSTAQTLGSWVRIPLEACICIRVSSLFMLSCVPVATGLVLPTICKIHISRLILLENMPEDLIRKVKEFYFSNEINSSRYSNRLRAYRGVKFRVPVGSRICSTSFRPALGCTQPPIQWVPRTLSTRVKRLGRAADHSPPTSAEVKKMWISTSTPPWLVKHRDSFTLPLPLTKIIIRQREVIKVILFI